MTSQLDEARPRRPCGPPVGYQEWRRLLFLHWAVSAEALRPLVPSVLSLDTFEGACYVGLVPFWVQAARPFGTPRGLGLAFVETNVRTYVRVDGREPGVYFFSLDAGSLAAVLGARASLGLPYFYARGREWLPDGGEDPVVNYVLQRRLGARPGCRVRYRIDAPLGAALPGTLEHFLIERYRLHVLRGPSLWTVQVHHRPYPLRRAVVLELGDELVAAAGLSVSGAPPLVHFSPGVDVEVFRPRVRLID